MRKKPVTRFYGRWISLIALGAGLSACMQEASFVRESPSGGIIGFPYTKEIETLSSLGRNEALTLMDRKCPAGYRIVKEGVLPRVNEKVDQKWRGTVNTVYDGGVEERLWGIQFSCK